MAARRGRAFWERTVRELDASGLSHAEFARKRGVGLSTLRSWIYRLRRAPGSSATTATTVRIVPVTLRPEPALSAEWLELAVGPVILRFRAGTDVAYVAELASRLGALRC